jgi:L-fucose isomerase
MTRAIPEDVKEKLLKIRTCCCRGCHHEGQKSYLQIGSVTMGIGGSIINPEFHGGVSRHACGIRG